MAQINQRSMFQRAYQLAVQAHSGQMDKAGQPYIGHPERVASGFSDDLLKTIAILHDLVEDTPVTLPEIELEFGPAVAREVDLLTRREDESYMDYIRRCALSPLACRVKIADLYDNLELSRNPQVLAQDEGRIERYQKALQFLQREGKTSCP
jgi:GTP diphosphokinase / guanosine-3',5'-bis(diphosphate) 3'-diphosphatase